MKAMMLMLLGIPLFFSSACESSRDRPQSEQQPSRRQLVEQKAREFFAIYAERSDWEGFLDLYRDDMQFEDALMQLHLESKEAFREFYDWPNEGFRKHPNHPKTLVLQELVVDENIAVGRGYFTPFYWNDKLWEMEWEATFTMWLFYDDDLKIRRQIDWIEYSGDVLQSIGKRIEQGDY